MFQSSKTHLSPPKRLGDRRLVQLIGHKGAGKTSLLLRWQAEQPGPYHYVHRIWSQPLPAQPNDPLGETTLLRGSWHLEIPPDLPPSFAVSDNAVQWLVTVHADVANRPDIVNTFTLPVLPEVVRDLR